MTTPKPNPRWYHLTPERFFLGLLVVQVFLFLSERFRWFPFNEHKGWTVLIAIGVVGVAVVVMAVWDLVCLLLRRRFQFSFRSLLVFVVTVSVPLGWFVWEMQRARRQREAVVAFTGAGGCVGYDYEMDEDGRWAPWPAEPTTPRWWRKLLGNDFFCEVVLVYCQHPYFVDNDARHLQRTTKPYLLRGDALQISDNDIAHLKGMNKLKQLYLPLTQVTDNGLRHLKGMTQLERLGLYGMPITDNGVAHLEGLSRLEWLSVVDTQISDEGVKKLQEALPNCKISY